MNEENTAKPKYTKTISIVSNKPDSKEHTFTISNKGFWALLLLLCVLVGAVLGIIIFGSRQIVQITNEALAQYHSLVDLQEQYAILQVKFDDLALVNEGLEDQVQVLSDTINKNALEDEAAAQAEAESRIPTGFPVTGSVTEAEPPEEDNGVEAAVYFEASESSTVVATAVGEVIGVRENAYGKYEIQIDHGNEYVSVFTNAGYPMVEEGVSVLKGTPLFYVQEENTLVKYQITYQGALVDVYSVMSIDG